MDLKCLNCGAVFVKNLSINEKGYYEIEMSEQLELETDGIHQFYTCPNCLAKNMFESQESEPGKLLYKITHTVE